MNKYPHWLLVVVLLLGLLAACGGGNTEESASSAPAQATAVPETAAQPTAQTQPTAVPPTAVPTIPPTREPTPAEPEVEEIDLSAFSRDLAFDTYSYSFIISMRSVDANGQEVTQTITAESKHTTNPPASLFVMNMEGFGAEDMGGMEQISITEVDGTVYTQISGFGCFSAASGTDNLMSEIGSLSPQTVLQELDISKVKRVRPNVTINGIETRHYTFDETLINATAAPGEEVSKAEGHLYIAENGGYLVKMVLDMEGNSLNMLGAELEPGMVLSTRVEYTLVSVNDPITITVPEECTDTTASDYPLLDDATGVSTFMGFTTYRSQYTLADARKFYEDELPALGYTYDETTSFSMSGSAMLVFKKEGGGSLTVMLNEESTGGISVTLMSNEE